MLQQPSQAAWPGSAAEMQRVASGGSPPQAAQHPFGVSPQGRDIPIAGAAAGSADAAAQQASLFPRLSPEAAELYAGGGGGGGATAAAAAQHQQAALKQNLQKLYGSLGLQHASRSSLPDIQENEAQMCLPSDPGSLGAQPGGSARLPYGRPPTGRAPSDEDLFGMQDLHSQQAAAAAAGGVPGMGAAGGAAPPTVTDLSLVGQLPAGASQSRTLFVRNVDPSVPEDELHTLFEAFGEVRSLYTAAKARGFVVVSYFDTRAATLAQHTLSGQALAGRALDVHFSLPKDDREAAQGTLLAAALGSPATRQELLFLFSQWGELREVREDPLRANCFLLEFYDVRHAAAALAGISQVPEAANRLVVMEAGAAAAALPGGGQQQQQGGQQQRAQPGMGASLSHEYLAGMGAAAGGAGAPPQPGGGQGFGGQGQGMRNVGSSPALLYGTTGSSSSHQLDYLLSGGGGGAPGMAAAASLQQLQQQAAAGGGGGYDAATAQLLQAAGLGSAAAGLGGAADVMAGMNRSFSDLSLDSGAAGMGVGGRFAPASMSTGDLLALTQGLQASAGAGLRGIASTGSIWPHQHQQASLGSSPVGGGWGAGAGGFGSAGNLQDLLQKQAAVNAALQQQAAVSAALGLQQGGPLAQQSAALQVAMQQAMLTQQAAALLGHGGLGGPGLMGGGGRRGDVPLGGRLARRPLDPVAEAERRMQQEKLYSLDLQKIRAGDDRRTTLMVKNIPNKYTQKMLLALVEEKFRGMFDFFYLPIDFKNKCNVGYAFINMVRPEYIVPLVEELHGKKWPKFNSEKICHIAYGRIQGKAALVQHFQNSSLLHEDKRCRPILFHSNGALAGEIEQFPGTLPSPSPSPALPGAGGVPQMAVAAAAAAQLPLGAAASGMPPLQQQPADAAAGAAAVVLPAAAAPAPDAA